MTIIKGVPRADHLITSGTRKFVVQASDVYTGLSAILGIAKITGTPPDDAIGIDASDAARQGLIGRVRITYKLAGEQRFKTTKLICAVDKLDTAITQLRGKTFRGGTIVGAGFPRRRRLG